MGFKIYILKSEEIKPIIIIIRNQDEAEKVVLAFCPFEDSGVS